MVNLEDKEWEDFSISGNNGIFKNYHGKRLVKEKRVIGKIPLLTAGEQNNGVSDFISNNNMDSFNNCISIDMFGNSFYHNYNCFGDDNIYFFLTDSLSKYTKLFIIELINKNKSKFSYGKQFRQKNADTLKVILPINYQTSLLLPIPMQMIQKEVQSRLYSRSLIFRKTAIHI